MTTRSAVAGGAPTAGGNRWLIGLFALVGLGAGLATFALRSSSTVTGIDMVLYSLACTLFGSILGLIIDAVRRGRASSKAARTHAASRVATSAAPKRASRTPRVRVAQEVSTSAVPAQVAVLDAPELQTPEPHAPELQATEPHATPDEPAPQAPELQAPELQATEPQATPDEPATPHEPAIPDEPEPATPHEPATPDEPAASAAPNPDTPLLAPVMPSTPALADSFEAPQTMTSKPSSFSDAARTNASQEPSWLPDTATPPDDADTDLERRALISQHETARHELILAHNQELARLATENQEATAGLQAELDSLRQQVRLQSVRMRNRSGDDQTRTGDLEAQVDALELELADLRRALENERITHTRRITEDRGAADRALDNARREYREELAKHVHTHRQTIADYRADLDEELAKDRARHASALEEQHQEYERQLEAERKRVETTLVAATERNEREVERLRATHRQELDRQAAQHKATISNLRSTSETTDTQQRELEKENRALRAELSSTQKHLRQSQTEHESTLQRTKDELTLVKNELAGERQRSAALRADVLRRSAESHQAVDKAVEERTAQLAELEASVARQRQYADTRVREVSAAAEEQARQAATREASLAATVSRLKRELEEAKRNL